MKNDCVACPASEGFELVERHHDKIGGLDYTIRRCASCGAVFSDPRDPVGPEWYEASAPIRGHEFKAAPGDDWRYAEFFRDELDPGKVLDLGCGDGGFLGLARARGWSIAGFDYDSRMIEVAKRSGVEDATADTFEGFFSRRQEPEFDAVTLFDVLEHVPEPKPFLDNVKRLMKPGAHLAITLPNAMRPIWFVREEHDYPPHHFTRWTPEALRDFLDRSGFDVVRQETGRLKLQYIADHIFFFGVMRTLLPLVKGLLFGAKARGKTVSEVAASGGAGGLSDPVRRHRMVAVFRAGMSVLIYPIAIAIKVFYGLFRDDAGDTLYTLARLRETR